MPDASGHFSPSECGDYGAALAEALDRIEALGIAFRSVSRLRREATLLLQVADDGAFPTGREERMVVAHAMNDAADWFDISHMLDSEIVRQISSDIRRAAKGAVGDTRQRATAYRYQSQLWWGSVLWRGRANPRPVTTVNGQRTPDFEVENGLAKYGVEAKRPESPESARQLVRDAAAQFEDHGVHGCVAIDLSECVHMQEAAFATTAACQALAEQHALTGFANTLERVNADVLTAHRNGDKRMRHVLAVFGILRSFSWAEDKGALALLAVTGGRLFIPNGRHTIVYHHMVTLLDQLTLGMQQIGYPVKRFKDVVAELR